jgi:uncharacterized protein YdhG (YjbR/CyaY superfamily)
VATSAEITAYQAKLSKSEIAICRELRKVIESALPKAEGKVWHGHPVWFIEGNPVVGYSSKKDGLELLFWSGQSFKQAGLTPIGKFKAAGIKFNDISELNLKLIKSWLKDCIAIQWDYANVIKKKKLEKLTKF